ncbi:serine protease [Fusarium denticulatum]|uniref:Pro-apoptotic serine protease NMA111 n=1 Tax=Fusarium denticulatum TaxID=48507 RepID=A0A8H5XBT1_9HYPO|nr:serine protease [Fusarium denticulatum]
MTIDQDPILTKLRDVSLSAVENGVSTHHTTEPEHPATAGLLSERESEAWQRAIEKVVRCVVSVKFSHPYSFDTETSKTSEATGFVVDAEKGIILTNRHVVGPGPFSGYIVFNNQEEVDTYPIYRDPVHDFGFLKFDPKAVKYMALTAMELRPDLAKVGTEIKVIGNDSGEKLGILSGFISRLDRNAPIYDGYMDFNTCYFQANASASGGSSGSPVVNVDGHGIALQAGGRTDGSTDYFLPLDGPLRALKQIQRGEKVKRGEIQTVFKLKPFDECRRLGLSPEWESVLRKSFPGEDNVIVAMDVLPEGPSDEKLKEGDILLKINGDLVTQFLRLNEIFDSNIGKTVRILVQRDGQDVEVDILVQDLCEITPDRFVTVGAACFHDLSYQIAQRYFLPCRGVYVSKSGPFHPTHDNYIMVDSVNHKKTPDLDAFVQVMKDIPDRARVAIKFWYVWEPQTVRTAVVPIDRHWFQRMKMFKRNDTTGVWDVEVLAEPLPAIRPPRLSASFDALEHIAQREIAEIARSFVHVRFSSPVLIDGQSARIKLGMGLVVNADRGYVIVSRTVVPTKLCDIELTFADSVLVPGKVVFLHPAHHYAIIQYDPSLVDAPVKSAIFSTERISQGAPTFFVGHNDCDEMVYASTAVTKVIPLEREPPNPPRGRPVNVDRIDVETRIGNHCGSGVLIREDGVVQALWVVYEMEDLDEACFGLSSQAIAPIAEKLSQGIVPTLRSLSIELEAVTMIEARVMGVAEEWIEKVQSKSSSDRRLFMVKRGPKQLPGQPGEGDVLLTLDDKLITQLHDVDVMYWKESLDVVAVRNGEQISFKAHTVSEDEFETSRVVNFCGLTAQKPHRTVRQSIKKLPSEVYITSWFIGSPANLYNVYATTFITHIDNKPTPDLESLVGIIASIPDKTYFKIKMMNYTGTPSVVTIKKDERYWPTVEWLRDDTHVEGWKRVTYENGEVIQGEGLYGITL